MRYVKKSGNLSIEIDGEKYVDKCEFCENKYAFNKNGRRYATKLAKKLITKIMKHLGFEVKYIVINIES